MLKWRQSSSKFWKINVDLQPCRKLLGSRLFWLRVIDFLLSGNFLLDSWKKDFTFRVHYSWNGLGKFDWMFACLEVCRKLLRNVNSLLFSCLFRWTSFMAISFLLLTLFKYLFLACNFAGKQKWKFIRETHDSFVDWLVFARKEIFSHNVAIGNSHKIDFVRINGIELEYFRACESLLTYSWWNVSKDFCFQIYKTVYSYFTLLQSMN